VPSGRLTMNWVGKDQALLTTPDGGYEWVDRTAGARRQVAHGDAQPGSAARAASSVLNIRVR